MVYNTMIKRAQGNQTELVKRSLVSYIYDAKLNPGSRLPPQAELRRRLGVGNATISRAIDELRRDGVLEVRDKVGVFLIDPAADGHMGRTVAVLALRARDSVFIGMLTLFLQLELMRRGCRMNLYCLQTNERKTAGNLADYPDLRRNVESGDIQGVIHFDDLANDLEHFLSEHRLPTLKLGGVNIPRRSGVYFDFGDILRRAMARLWAEGVERPALLESAALERFLADDYRRLLGRFRDAPPSRVYSGYDQNDGRKLAREFAALPRDERPDGIVIVDDIVGGGFSSELALLLPPEELPLAAIMRNPQLNITFAFPRRLYYNIDIEEYAVISVERMMNDLKGIPPAEECQCYEVKEDASELHPDFDYHR